MALQYESEDLTQLVLPLAAPPDSGLWPKATAVPARSLRRALVLFARRWGLVIATAIAMLAVAGTAFVYASGGDDVHTRARPARAVPHSTPVIVPLAPAVTPL